MSAPVPCDPGIGLIHLGLKNPLLACACGVAAAVAIYCSPIEAKKACADQIVKVGAHYECAEPVVRVGY